MGLLNRNQRVTIEEIPEARVSQKASDAEIEKAVAIESERILKRISPMEKVILLDVKGKMLTTTETKKKMHELSDGGQRGLCIVIGGSYGVNREMFLGKAFSLSFSMLTFPHQLMRLVLLEQLNRILL